MKNIWMYIIAAIIPILAVGQNNDINLYGRGKMPFNEEGVVVFSKIANAPNCSASDIYNAAKLYIVETFRSANDVIQLSDSDNHLIVGKGFNYVSSDDLLSSSGYLYFTIKIQCKDGRFKIEVYQLMLKLPKFSIYAEYCTDSRSIKKNGKIRKGGYGLWRRMIIDNANGVLLSAQMNILKNLADERSTQNGW